KCGLSWAGTPSLPLIRAVSSANIRDRVHPAANIGQPITCAAVRLLPTRLPGLVAFEPVVHGDERGFFCETFRSEWQAELSIGEERFLQDNHSRSGRGVLRGMHFQLGEGLGKLVRCARGRILDVAVDLRRGSPTYARWEAVELDDESMRALYVPV